MVLLIETIGEKKKLEGVWRMLSYRTLEGESKKYECDSGGSRASFEVEKICQTLYKVCLNKDCLQDWM